MQLNETTTRPAALRMALMLLLLGILLLRQNFVHRQLGELLGLWARHLYICELALALLLPAACLEFWRRRAELPGFTYLCALLLWAMLHLIVGLYLGDSLLAFRQSVLAGYALFYPLAFVAFAAADANFIRHWLRPLVLLIVVAAAVSILDFFELYPFWQGDYGSRTARSSYPYFHQMTLSFGLLALLCCVFLRAKWRSIPALLALALGICFCAVQFLRLQSTVLFALLATFSFMLPLGLYLRSYGSKTQDYTPLLKVAVLGLCCLATAYLLTRNRQVLTRLDNPQALHQEASAWSIALMREGLTRYRTARWSEATETEKTAFEAVLRGPFRDEDKAVRIEEAFKVYAALEFVRTPSAKNNLWRLLVWQALLRDCWNGRWLLGHGFGHPWRYEALLHLPYYGGEPGLGLAPHCSYLSLLYHLGLMGSICFFALLFCVLKQALKRLKTRLDPEAFGYLSCWVFAAIFACFTVSLEGPAYGLPFWMLLGLIAARSKDQTA